MKQIYIITLALVSLLLVGCGQYQNDQNNLSDKQEKTSIEYDNKNQDSYINISSKQFVNLRQQKDIYLVDVHIPEQDHIDNTDLVLAYNQIKANLDELPDDKKTNIVVYCRSGGMSKTASQVLIANGYKNVYNLVGGKISYDKYLKSAKSDDIGKDYKGEYKTIKVKAKRFEYNPSKIVVQKGQKVRLKIKNIDYEHTILIKDMDTTKKDGYIILDTAQEGVYNFRCSNYCGSGHSQMKGKIVVK